MAFISIIIIALCAGTHYLQISIRFSDETRNLYRKLARVSFALFSAIYALVLSSLITNMFEFNVYFFLGGWLILQYVLLKLFWIATPNMIPPKALILKEALEQQSYKDALLHYDYYAAELVENETAWTLTLKVLRNILIEDQIEEQLQQLSPQLEGFPKIVFEDYYADFDRKEFWKLSGSKLKDDITNHLKHLTEGFTLTNDEFTILRISTMLYVLFKFYQFTWDYRYTRGVVRAHEGPAASLRT